MVDFLGDPKIPEKAMRASRTMQIAYFQGLYKQYSRMKLTVARDRPIAISGLEIRLRKAFETDAGFGIFDDGPGGELFCRSILWQRGEERDDGFLEPIDSARVPSWSWMAYTGGIDYTDPPFGSADWEGLKITPPPIWSQDLSLAAMVRDFTVAGRLPGEVKLIYDTERTTSSDGQRAQCVIVAKSKEGLSDREKRHYVLLVVSTVERHQRELYWSERYERVGAGLMLGKHINLDDPGISARIL